MRDRDISQDEVAMLVVEVEQCVAPSTGCGSHLLLGLRGDTGAVADAKQFVVDVVVSN